MNFLAKAFIFGTLFIVLLIVLQLFLGYYLWNNAVVHHFTFLKPSPSIWHFFGVLFFFGLMMPRAVSFYDRPAINTNSLKQSNSLKKISRFL